MKTSHHIYAILGFGIILAGASVANPALKKAPAATQPVIVTNTASTPVPVIGTVNIGNTVGSAVPVSVLGTPNVSANVSGTVNIGNPGGSPVLVRNVDEKARIAFDLPAELNLSASDSDATSEQFYTVPLGKTLVLESVTLVPGQMVPGQRMVALGFNGGSQYRLEIHDNGTDQGGHVQQVATLRGTVRIRQGLPLSIFAVRDEAGPVPCRIDAVFNGYLEPQ